MCNLIAAGHDFLGQRYLACSYVLPHWHASYEHDNDDQNCLSPKMITSHWKMALKIFEVNVQIRGPAQESHASGFLLPQFLDRKASAQRFGCSVPQKLARDIIGVVGWGKDVGDSKSNSARKITHMFKQ